MAYTTTAEFKTCEEQENHDIFVSYLRQRRGQTFRGWLVNIERRIVQEARRDGELPPVGSVKETP